MHSKDIITSEITYDLHTIEYILLKVYTLISALPALQGGDSFILQEFGITDSVSRLLPCRYYTLCACDASGSTCCCAAAMLSGLMSKLIHHRDRKWTG